jgi:glycosyltransferase involved in cell wall biosynthesis
MTWTFPDEIKAHANGWIDYFGFVSRYQEGVLRPQLEQHRPVTALPDYRPFFNTENPSQHIAFSYRAPREWFGLGRVSRDDADKFAADTWNILYKVCSPIPKKVFILGYGPKAHSRCGEAPAGLDWQTWLPNQIPVRQLYGMLHALIHKTGGSRESYCRIVPEAYAAGVPIIVEDDFAFPELIVDGETGFLCKSSDEMSFRASELAFNEARRKRIVDAGYEYLKANIASAPRCWEAWKKLLE